MRGDGRRGRERWTGPIRLGQRGGVACAIPREVACSSRAPKCPTAAHHFLMTYSPVIMALTGIAIFLLWPPHTSIDMPRRWDPGERTRWRRVHALNSFGSGSAGFSDNGSSSGGSVDCGSGGGCD